MIELDPVLGLDLVHEGRQSAVPRRWIQVRAAEHQRRRDQSRDHQQHEQRAAEQLSLTLLAAGLTLRRPECVEIGRYRRFGRRRVDGGRGRLGRRQRGKEGLGPTGEHRSCRDQGGSTTHHRLCGRHRLGGGRRVHLHLALQGGHRARDGRSERGRDERRRASDGANDGAGATSSNTDRRGETYVLAGACWTGAGASTVGSTGRSPRRGSGSRGGSSTGAAGDATGAGIDSIGSTRTRLGSGSSAGARLVSASSGPPNRASAPPRSKWKPVPAEPEAARLPPPSLDGSQFRRGRPPIGSYTLSFIGCSRVALERVQRRCGGIA